MSQEFIHLIHNVTKNPYKHENTMILHHKQFEKGDLTTK